MVEGAENKPAVQRQAPTLAAAVSGSTRVI